MNKINITQNMGVLSDYRILIIEFPQQWLEWQQLKLQLMLLRSSQDVSIWSDYVSAYEKSKRTKRPFGKEIYKTQSITHPDIKHKESLFNPILHTCRHNIDEANSPKKEAKSEQKVILRNIVTNHSSEKNIHKNEQSHYISHLKFKAPDKNKPSRRKQLLPIRNIHNVINNEKIPDSHYSHREIKLPKETHHHYVPQTQRHFCIISNSGDGKFQEEKISRKRLLQNYRKSCQLDPINIAQQKSSSTNHETNSFEKIHMKKKIPLPPSYTKRESYIQDPTKPTPQIFTLIDKNKLKKLDRYKLKYIIEQALIRRNEIPSQNSKKLFSKAKQNTQNSLNIITHRKHESEIASSLE